MADIFLSYTSSDRAKADKLRTWFEEAGWTVWWDRQIPVGEEWEDTLGVALAEARVVVVLWGVRSRTSAWVLREASFARDANKLIQVRCTGLPMPLGFSDLQWIRFEAWANEDWHHDAPQLLAAVASALGVAPPAVPLFAIADAPDRHLARKEIAQLVFWFCAVRIEFSRLNTLGAAVPHDLVDELGETYLQLQNILDPIDHESLHEMISIMMDPLESFAPPRLEGA